MQNIDEVNSGVIITKFEITWNCNNTHNDCIRNLQEFKEYAKLNNCGKELEPDLPEVNFDEYSILIHNIVENGCCLFNRNVSVDSINKVVTYTIDHIKCRCDGIVAMDVWTVDNNMVLVPKIPEGFRVDFKYN